MPCVLVIPFWTTSTMNQWESVSQRDQSERIGTLERGRVCRVEPEGNGTTAAGAARAIISKWSTGTSIRENMGEEMERGFITQRHAMTS